jgi:mannose PTS system EIIA component
VIGILIVAHGTLAESLIHCASHVLGKRPMRVRQLGVTIHDDPAALLPQAQDLVAHLDDGHGVLILTDIYGATPANLAAKLLQPGRVEGLAGVNLPMLVRALTYREQPLEVMIAKAMSGGCEGVLRMPATAGSVEGAGDAAH